jgi:N-acetylmuramoyl-L-alanine amidase
MARLTIRRLSAAVKRALGPSLVSCACAALLAASQLSAQQTTPADAARFVVVIDAAHGGDDPGGRLGSGQPEKAFTLALGVRLRSLLAARGMQVVTTRESDTSIDLDRRAEIANRANAQACLSLHASESGSGMHLFVSSLAPTEPARFVAWKTAQSAWVTRSLALAGVVNSSLLRSGMKVTLGRTSLLAVDSMACPALAIEVAPERTADHKTTAALDNPEYQARVAGVLAAALLQWRAEVPKP